MSREEWFEGFDTLNSLPTREETRHLMEEQREFIRELVAELFEPTNFRRTYDANLFVTGSDERVEGIKKRQANVAPLARGGRAPGERQEVPRPVFFADESSRVAPCPSVSLDQDLPVTGLREVLDSLGEVLDGLSQLLDTRILRSDTGTACATSSLSGMTGRTDVSQETSPSVGGAGAHSVGEGAVAGVETAAPVTDTTNKEITDLANLIEELHEQGESWRTIAKNVRYIFLGIDLQTS